MRSLLWLLPVLILGLSFVGGPATSADVVYEPTWTPPHLSEVEQEISELEFDEFIEASYRLYLLRFPQTVTDLGMAQSLGVRNDQLNDYSEEYIAETERIERYILERLRSFDRDGLPTDRRTTYDVCEWYWDDVVRRQEFTDHDYLVTHYFITSRDWGLYDLLTVTHPLSSVRDVEDYLARLAQVGTQFDQLTDGLETRAQSGIVAPQIVLTQAIYGLRGLVNSSARYHPFYARLANRLPAVPGLTSAHQSDLLTKAETLIDGIVLPAYRRLYDKLVDLEGIASTELGYGGQPNGTAYYSYALRHQNQTDLTALEIHELGLQQVARLQGEIEAAAVALGYPSGLPIPSIYNRVSREGGSLYGAAVVTEYQRVLNEARERAQEVFETMPSTPVVIVGDTYGGYYRPAPTDGSRPAQFVAPTSGSQPRYSMPTLTYHETIPGHHMQIATAGELGLPLIRAVEAYLGYTEGWALYAERLAWELGWYDEDPYGNLGRLSDEMMRAVRLVVDTGIHAMAWTFDEAVDYFVENTGRPRSFAEGQILRYAVWPGQSTAYMVGFLKMLDLRDRVREALGEAFDLAAFHTLILENGSLPLEILERIVDRFIEEASTGD
jgi:uncharacterized protein (DUF885 family)